MRKKKKKKRIDAPSLFLLLLIGFLLISIAVVLFIMNTGEEKKRKINLQEKIWVSYGDSITDGGFWQAAVANKFSLEHIDLGISGTLVSGYSSSAYWQEWRLNEIISYSPDVITILGGTNDFFSGVWVGDLAECEKDKADKDLASFFGAYSYLIETLQEALPNSLIVIITTPLNYTHFYNETNRSGHSIVDFADASAAIADYYNLLLADLRTISYTETSFQADFWDGVHPNLEGCAKISEIVIATLQEVHSCLLD